MSHQENQYQVKEFLSVSEEIAKEQENIYSVLEVDRGTFGGAEQAAIEEIATNAEQSKLKHPSSNVFG